MSALATEEMSAVETGQMSAAKTGHMSSVARTDICVVPTHNVEVSEISIVAISPCSNLRNLNCGNVTMCKSHKGGLALDRRKLSEMGPELSPGLENPPK